MSVIYNCLASFLSGAAVAEQCVNTSPEEASSAIYSYPIYSRCGNFGLWSDRRWANFAFRSVVASLALGNEVHHPHVFHVSTDAIHEECLRDYLTWENTLLVFHCLTIFHHGLITS